MNASVFPSDKELFPDLVPQPTGCQLRYSYFSKVYESEEEFRKNVNTRLDKYEKKNSKGSCDRVLKAVGKFPWRVLEVMEPWMDQYLKEKLVDSYPAGEISLGKIKHTYYGPDGSGEQTYDLSVDYLKGLSGSYGIAIILLTVIVRVVFWPVTQRANNSMRKMAKIQPKIKELREKYKERPQEMNAKMMELYREEKVNPVGGCLPILLQLPVFFALSSVLESAVELRHVSFLWAADLTKPDLVDPPLLFGYGIHPLILIMTVLMVIQQKMTPSTMDPMQQKMMMAMPVIMLVMLYNLPSGLTLYWTVSQIFSILQMKYSQYIAKREDEKEALKSKSA